MYTSFLERRSGCLRADEFQTCYDSSTPRPSPFDPFGASPRARAQIHRELPQPGTSQPRAFIMLEMCKTLLANTGMLLNGLMYFENGESFLCLLNATTKRMHGRTEHRGRA